MIMQLPNLFESQSAIVKDGKLYITELYKINIAKGCVINNFRSISYSLIYNMRRKECIYCKIRRQLTIDHRIPRAYGGTHITNNLYICCSKCNERKGNLLHEQFLEIDKINKYKKEKINEIRKLYQSQNKKIIEQDGFILDKEYIENINLSNINVSFKGLWRFSKKGYTRIKKQYDELGSMYSPVILDKNGVLISGQEIYAFAKSNDIQIAKGVILENVEVI